MSKIKKLMCADSYCEQILLFVHLAANRKRRMSNTLASLVVSLLLTSLLMAQQAINAELWAADWKWADGKELSNKEQCCQYCLIEFPNVNLGLIHLYKYVPIIQVTINGHPVRLLLDTGSTYTVIDQAAAKEFGLKEQEGGEGEFAFGDQKFTVAKLQQLDLGSCSTNNMDVAVQDLSKLKWLDEKLAGLLGLDVLGSFAVTVDYRKKLIELSPKVFPLAKNAIVLPCHSDDWGRLWLSGNIDNANNTSDMLVDTGCDFSSISESTVSKIIRKPLVIWKSVQDGAGVEEHCYHHTFKKLIINDISFDKPKFAVTCDTQSDTTLGANFLRKYRITLDFPGKRLILEPYP
jgi:predicted aspartyl protease